MVHLAATPRLSEATLESCLHAAPPPQRLRRVSAPTAPSAMGSDQRAPGMLQWVNTGVNGANAVGTLITLPTEVIKVADSLGDAAQALRQRGHLVKALKHTPLAQVGSRATGVTLRVLEESPRLSKAAHSMMNLPVIGRALQPEVADFMTKKVMPTANALASGLAIYDHGRKFHKAHAAGDVAAQTVSGIQIGLNAICAVTGYFPGHAQTVSAVTGLGSLVLDVGSWATGVGYVKL